MSYEEFRREMQEFVDSAYNRPESLKEGNFVLISVKKLYARFDEVEKQMADRVLCEWLLSGSRLSTIAFYVIKDQNIVSATPALQELAKNLTDIETPMARDRLKEVQTLLACFMLS
jgi:hypothetical protein